MSLGNWEGKVSDEAEPEELPKVICCKFCERQKGIKSCGLFCLIAEKFFVF